MKRTISRWTAFLLAFSLIAIGPVSVARAAGSVSKTLMDFADASSAARWLSVNDTVMGGVSEGGFRITDDKTLEFFGNLSLKNRGGFASIRTRPAELDLGDFDKIVLRLKGDGRAYYFELRTAALGGAESYRVPVETSQAWQEVSLPLTDFVYTSFGRRVPGAPPLRPSRIQSLGFMLADKKAGPFRLEIGSIRAEKGTASAEQTDAITPHSSAGSMDIVETAIAAGQFNTLVAAVKAAGLVDALKGEGPLTVFAPNDDAFDRLPEGTVEDLLKPENREKLGAVLTYHVVPGKILLGTQAPTTLQGESLEIRAAGAFEVNGVEVIATDISASNGVIHVVDAVLMPPVSKLTPREAARSVIERAIERGVPLFNSGQPSGCAAVYDVAIDSLLKSHSEALDDEERSVLRDAVRKAWGDETPREKAWTLPYTEHFPTIDALTRLNCAEVSCMDADHGKSVPDVYGRVCSVETLKVLAGVCR
jgi:uncharacterized surface protein with fasciclin (FAS1) repeats